ncbi:MAG: hypothetical protein ABR592_04410 [Nitriliruptorales bacterium]
MGALLAVLTVAVLLLAVTVTWVAFELCRRREPEDAAFEAIHGLERTLLGSAARGAVGERILAAQLKKLPTGMVQHGWRLGSKQVEFALALPDGRRIAVDSKLVSVDVRSADTAVATRVAEVAGKYIDPELTAPFAVVAVPDAVFAACQSAHIDAVSAGVLVVPYSQAGSMLATVVRLVDILGVSAGAAALAEVDRVLAQIEADQRLAQARARLDNAADAWPKLIAKARGVLAAARAACT